MRATHRRWWILTIKALQPLRVKVAGQIRVLVPGQTLELTESQGQRLLTQAPGRVRVVPAVRAQLTSQEFVWWQGGNGVLHGPAHVELLALTEDDMAWLGVSYEGTFHWIREDLIRHYTRDNA